MSGRLTDSQIPEGLRLDMEPPALTWQYAVLIAAGGVPKGRRMVAQWDAANRCAWLEAHYASALAEVQALRGQVGALNKAMTRVRNADIRMMTGVQRHSVASAQAADPNDEAFHRGVTVGVDRCREILAEALAVSR